MSEGNKIIVLISFKIVHKLSVGKSHSKSSFREQRLEGTLRKWFEDVNPINP